MTDWGMQRAKLNHDLLKNQVIPSLDRLKRLAEGSISGDGLFVECCEHLHGVWSELYVGLQFLLKRAETGQGPTNWFSMAPLNRLDEHDLKWMRDLVMAHCSNEIWVKAEQMLIELDAIDHDIKQLFGEMARMRPLEEIKVSKEASIGIEKKLLDRLAMVRKRVSKISDRLSALPTVNILQCLPRLYLLPGQESQVLNIMQLRTSACSSLVEL